MPVPEAVESLAALWPGDKPLYVVGGAVRDYVYHLYHAEPFAPKDFDLASQLTAAEVVVLLKANRIPFVAIGAAFGVIQARVEGTDYEIASFRDEWYDPEAGDGRRPDTVRQGVTPEADAQRRDLYINALFYDLATKEVKDFNGGEGLEDVRAKKVRPVGKARDRFREDRLRVVRLVRFFSRYSTEPILDGLDEECRLAVVAWSHLPGISAERKLAEFLGGLQQARVPGMYLTNLWSLDGLVDAMFPGLCANATGLELAPECRNPKAVLAWLFRNSERKHLSHPSHGLGNRLKFPSWLTDRIDFLLAVWAWGSSPIPFDPAQAHAMVRLRDKFLEPKMSAQKIEFLKHVQTEDVCDFNSFARLDRVALAHFLQYESTVTAGIFVEQGLVGVAVGNAVRLAEASSFSFSRKKFSESS